MAHTITVAQAKRDYSIGFLTAYRLDRRTMSVEWSILLGEGMSAAWLVDARSKVPRAFKSLDSAIRALEEIGFEVNTLS